MKHTNKIAIKVLDDTYGDYNSNPEDYNQEYKMLVIAQNELAKKILNTRIELPVITDYPITDNWGRGIYGKYGFTFKYYEEASDDHVNSIDGHLGKLDIYFRNNELDPIVMFDRMWIVRPKNYRNIYNIILKHLKEELNF